VGTATCVGHRDGFAYLLTADHVVPKGEARVYDFFTPGEPKPARQLTRGTVVLRLADADVAVVKVPAPGEPPPTLRLAGPDARPKRFPVTARAAGCPAATQPTARDESVVGKRLVRRPAGGVAFFWQVATAPVAGMSGGPLIWDGKLIGVCSATQGGVGYFTHLDEILYGLAQNRLKWLAG
jgi:S1-C subfamily serine protease